MAAKKAIQDGYEWLLTNDQGTTFKPNTITKMTEQITKIDTKKVANSKVTISDPVKQNKKFWVIIPFYPQSPY